MPTSIPRKEQHVLDVAHGAVTHDRQDAQFARLIEDAGKVPRQGAICVRGVFEAAGNQADDAGVDPGADLIDRLGFYRPGRLRHGRSRVGEAGGENQAKENLLKTMHSGPP